MIVAKPYRWGSGLGSSIYSVNFANANDAPIPGEPDQPTGTSATAAAGNPSGAFTGSFSLGSLQIPYWAAGLAAIVGLWFFGGSR